MICAKCGVLCEGVCPACGSKRHLRAEKPDEPAHLITLSAMQAMLVEPVLKDTGIPYFKRGSVGGALTAQVGMMREVFRFFVPVRERERCRAAIEDVFGADAGIMRLLHEFD